MKINYHQINLPLSDEIAANIDIILKSAFLLKDNLNISLSDAIKVIEIAYAEKGIKVL